MASETWERGGLVFNPYANFFEFIPMEESLRSREDERFVPRTVLLDGVEPGKSYEVVITNFYGMAFLRYRVGHYVAFLPASEQDLACDFPQFRFEGRTDDRIDLAGFTRLDAKAVWEALNASGVAYQDWTVRKEHHGDIPVLHLYVELRKDAPAEWVRLAVHEAIRSVDPFYGDLESMLGIAPLRVTLLTRGAFDRFYDRRRDLGYDLEQRTPPKMNPTDEDVEELLVVGVDQS